MMSMRPFCIDIVIGNMQFFPFIKLHIAFYVAYFLLLSTKTVSVLNLTKIIESNLHSILLNQRCVY